MRILFTGSVRGIGNPNTPLMVKAAARDLRVATATRRHEILVGSDNDRTVDRYVVEEAREVYAGTANGMDVVEAHRMRSQNQPSQAGMRNTSG